MSRTVAEVIVDVFQSAGVERCYGIPGDTLNHFAGAIKASEIRWIQMRHEEAGAFAAAADAQLTGKLTVIAGSCGPGSLHFINGVYDAHRNGAPMVLIASQIARDSLGFEFPQEVDFKAVYKDCSCYCDEIRTPEQAERKVALAVQMALAERDVAVLIVPVDVAAATIAPRGAKVHHVHPTVTPSYAELAAMAAILNEGENIAIYGGIGCQHAHDQVVSLAQRLCAPIARTTRAKDFLGYDNPYDVGMTGVLGMKSGYDAVLKCDTLLVLGCGFAWSQFYPDHAKIVQVDLKAKSLGRRHAVDLGVVGDVGPTIEALLPLLRERSDRRFLDAHLKQTETSLAKQNRPAKDPHVGRPIHPQFMVETIARQAAPDAVWACDDGSAVVFAIRHVPATGQNRTLASFVHGTMASGLASALGAKAAFPDRQVIALCGDGGLTMLMGDMLTAVQEKLPVKIAVVNNHSLGFVELEQRVEGMLSTYTGLENPDFGKVAEAMGYWGRRVTRGEDLEDAVREWLAQSGPALLDVVTSRYELIMPPKAELPQALGMAMYGLRAVLAGQTDELTEMATQNFLY